VALTNAGLGGHGLPSNGSSNAHANTPTAVTKSPISGAHHVPVITRIQVAAVPAATTSGQNELFGILGSLAGVTRVQASSSSRSSVFHIGSRRFTRGRLGKL